MPHCKQSRGYSTSRSNILAFRSNEAGTAVLCPAVWIAERQDEYLPLVNQQAIRGIMYRTAKAADLGEYIAALRERRMWIQALDYPDDATPSRQEKWACCRQDKDS
jgi:hypothetical protein